MDLYYCAPLLTFLVGHKRSLKRQRICDPSLGIRCKFLEAAQATPSPPEFMPLCALASSTILGEELSATFSNFMWGRIGGTWRCKLHWARRLLGMWGSWVHIAVGSCKYIGFWQSLRSLLQNLCLSVPFGWHKGGSKCINEGEVHQGRRLLGLHIYRSAAVQTVGFGEVLHLFAVYTYDQPRRRVRDSGKDRGGARGLFAACIKGDVSL